MIFNQISLTIKYSKINNFNLRFRQNKNFFDSRFKIVAEQDIPDNIPMVIPNCIYKSNEDHSEIAISSEVVVFNIYKIDNGYETNWELCKEYLNKVVKMIFDFLNLVSENTVKYQYMGAIVNINYDNDQTKVVLEKMKSSNANLLINDTIFDFVNRYTYVKDNSIFVNIEIKNIRLFKEGTSDQRAGDLSLNNQIKEFLNFTIDINDRYSFNEFKDYVSNKGIVVRLIDEIEEVINNKINKIITGGN